MSKVLTDSHIHKIDALNKQAWELNRKDPVKAISLSEEAIKESEKHQYKLGRALALKTIGASYVWISRNEEAMTFSFDAVELFQELKDKANEAETYYNIGANFRYISDFDSAIKYYNKCYQVSKEANNEVGMADGLNGLGSVYYNMNENQKALEVLLESQKLCLKHQCEDIYIKVLDGIGESYYNMGEHKKALDYYIQCAELSRKLGNKQVEAFALDGLGRTYAALKKNKEAITNFDQSLKLRIDISFKPGQVISLLNKGIFLLENNDLDEAIKLFQDSMSLAEAINSKEGIYKASEQLAIAFEKKGDYQKAITFYKKFSATRDEVITETTAQQVRSVEMQHKMLHSQTEKTLLEEKARELENYSNNLVLLGEIGQKIISQLNVASIVETVYDSVNQLMDAAGFGVGLVHHEKNQIQFPLFIEGGENFNNINYDLSDPNKLSTICFLESKEIVINDVENEIKNYIKIDLKPTFGKIAYSVIYLPLLVKGKKVGVITVQSFSKNAYNPYHLNILRNLASYAAIALENASLYEEQEKIISVRTQEAIEKKQEVEKAYQNNKRLSELGQQITASLNFEEIFQKLHTYVSDLMDAGFFGVRLYNPSRNVIEYKYGIEKGVRNAPMEVSMNDVDNYSVWCVSNKKEIFINDNEKEYKRYTKKIVVVTGDLPHSLIFYPILINDKALGCITVQSFERNAYTDYHLDILKTLATYTAIALENANLFELMEERVKERTQEVVKQKEEIEKTYQNAKILSEIGNEITSLLSVKEIVNNVYSSVNNLMDASGFGIGVTNLETGIIEFPLYIEGDEKFDNVNYNINEADKLASISYNKKQDIIINDFKNEIEKYVGYVQAPLQGKVVESIIYLPLKLKEKVLGVITVQSFKKNAYTAYEVEMLRSLAVYIAIAIDNAGLYAGMEERVRERTKEIDTAYQNNKLLSEIGQHITSTLNFEDVFERLHSYIYKLMDAESFGVRVYNKDSDTIEYKYEIEKMKRDHQGKSLPADPTRNFSAWVIKNKKELILHDFLADYKKYLTEATLVGGDTPQSAVMVPIVLGERVLGAITVQSFRKNAYTDYHVDILKNLANYTAIAFDNAALYETLEEKVRIRTAEVVLQKEEVEKTYENTKILSQIGKDISSTFSIQEIISKVYANLNTLMDATCFGIGVYREKSNEIVFPATIEKKKHLMPYSYSLKDEDRPAVWCYTTQQDYIINNFSEEFIKSNKVQDYQAKEGDNPESIIYVPITHNNKKIGVITVQSFKQNSYKDYHLQILKSLSVYVAIAIDNASLYNNLEDRVRERTEEIEKNYNDTRLIGEISKELSSSLSIETVISSVYKNIHQLMKADSFGIGIFNSTTNHLEFKGFMENLQVLPFFTIDTKDQNRLASICFINNTEIVINNFVTEHSKYIKLERKPVQGNDNMSVLYLPMYSKNETIGVISVQALDKNAYSEYHVNILKNLAVSIGIALDNASLYENLEEKVKERTLEVVQQKEEIERTYESTRLLSEIGKEISSTLSIEGIITKVYDHINKLMDASAFGIGIYREEENDLYHPCIIEKGKKLPPFSYPLSKERVATICFKENKEFVINDWLNEFSQYVKDTDYKPVAGENPQSVIYIPLSQKGKNIGVLSVQSFNTNAYKEYHLNIIRNLAVYIASAIDNASLYQNLEERVEERTEEIRVAYENTRLLSQIAEDISSSLSVETIIAKVYQNVNKLMDATCFGIGIYNARTGNLEFKGFVENNQIMEDFEYHSNDPNRLAAQCFSGAKDIFINDFTIEYSNYIKGIPAPLSGKDSTSIIYLPIYSKEIPIGVITVQSYQQNAYTEYHFNILKNLAVSVGIALDNAALYQNLEEKVNERTSEVVKQKEEIERTYENTRLLSQIGNDITSTLSIEEIIEKVYANVNNLMDATGFGVGVFKEDTSQIIYPVYIEGEKKFEEVVYEKNDENRLTNICFYQNREIVINNFLKEIKHYISNYEPPLIGQNVESIIYLPLTLKDKKLGVITVQSFKKNRYSDYHLQILKNLAVYVAIALDNASLYENLENMVQARTREVIRQKELLEKNFSDTKLIAQISKDITSSLSIEVIISTVYENVNKVMKSESFGIGIYNSSTESLQFPGFIEKGNKMPYFEFPLNDKERYAVWCFENGKEIIINDIEKEYQKYVKSKKAPIAGAAPSSLIYLPLIINERKIGVITVQSFTTDAYNDYQINLFRNLANSVSIAVDNAHLYQNLEDKVKSRTEEVFRQKAIIEEKNKDITDSIQYAKKIQLALMTETNLFHETFHDSFVFFKPKDIVSGDFYWATQKQIITHEGKQETLVYLAVCDSTGHGVPGAFMSLLNISFLNEAINEKNITSPNEVFNYVRNKLITNISKEGQKDGFDGTLLCINKTTGDITYSAAYNPPILVSGNKLAELHSDRMPVGYGERQQEFSLNTVKIKKGDTLYLSTDGYADQFGGPKGKKFMFKKLNELILSISKLSLSEQSSILSETFEDWKGELEQIDDVCIIGLKF